ncbi:hypothetical protein MKZ38_004407 [Zalerion maritima]|uniref:Clr5 domain-containing protein n=1 Tax=Zalerion maritima TaxID=339359 RepID=A0AAD5RMI1_9PEZI|nr:hypothetical protein MKZ38_004407 [Zalerion maritima]
MRSIAPAPARGPANGVVFSAQCQITPQPYSSTSDLDLWKETILCWYLKDGMKLRHVQDNLSKKGIRVTTNQLKHKFTRWNVEKNRRRKSAASLAGTQDGSATPVGYCQEVATKITRTLHSSRSSLVVMCTQTVWQIQVHYQHRPALRTWWWWDLYADLQDQPRKLLDKPDRDRTGTSEDASRSDWSPDSESSSRTALSDLPDATDDPLITFGLIAMFTKLRTASCIETLLQQSQVICHSPSVKRAKTLVQDIYDNNGGDAEHFHEELLSLLSEIPTCIRSALGDLHPITTTLMSWLGHEGARFFLSVNKLDSSTLSPDILSSMYPAVEAHRWSPSASPADTKLFLNMARNFHRAVSHLADRAPDTAGPQSLRWHKGVASEFLAVAERRRCLVGPSPFHAVATGLLEEAIRYYPKSQDGHVALSQLGLLRQWYAEVGDWERGDRVQAAGDQIFAQRMAGNMEGNGL